MSDPRFQQPWHGIPRGEIAWSPTVTADLCIGCGICVTACGRGVLKYDYASKKAATYAPEDCMVGCTSCMNLCPEQAISFPPMSDLRLLIKRNKVLQRVKKVELSDHERWGLPEVAEIAS